MLSGWDCAWTTIELAVNILEKQLKGLDDMETWTSTIQSNGAKIAKEIEKIRETANVQIEQLRVLPERTQTGGVRHEESSPTTLSGKAIWQQLANRCLRGRGDIPGTYDSSSLNLCLLDNSRDNHTVRLPTIALGRLGRMSSCLACCRKCPSEAFFIFPSDVFHWAVSK
jgi:hypothetical protein